MNFGHVLYAVIGLLLLEGRLSYRRLRLEFGLDDHQLEALKAELIEVKRLAFDHSGQFLTWAGDVQAGPARLAPVAAETFALTPPEATAAIAPPVADAERRQLTVMFCDLVGSTELSTRLDPEDLQDVLRAYQNFTTEIVHQLEGFVAKYMGDGILVYFGYPQALERDTERAIRCALGIVDAMPALNQDIGRSQEVELAVRIGIATGIVVVGEVVGEGAASEKAVIGETPNLAARLQGLASPNGIIIGSVTRDLAGDVFDYVDHGAHELKGIAGLVKAWVVRGLREPVEEAESEAGSALALVGRDEEIGLLRRAWQSTKEEGRGRVVMIAGEPGIGKTALVESLRARAREEGLPRIAFRCSPYHTNSVLYPVIEHVKRLLRWQQEDTADTRLEKLEAMLAGYSLPLAEIVPLFAALLSLPLPQGRYPALELDPQQRKQQTQDALIAWTFEEAERRPMVEIWEDLHWADPSTLELLGLLVEQAPTAPILLVLTFRPEFVPPWTTRSHVTPISLNRLERPQIEVLVTRLAGGKALPAEVLEHVVAKTDGVPLYVEELTKTILESGIVAEEAERFTLKGPLSAVTIPATLQESLMARLDRIPKVREVAQLGAVLGREFAYEMLQALAEVEEPTLQDGLGQLVGAELLYQRGRPPRARYVFKHALVQDAAYQSLLRRTRQRYHRQVAELLEARFPEVVETQPELLAHHYTEARAVTPAVDYWRRAGQRASERSANLEAISHFTSGLALLDTLPETQERLHQEIALQVPLGAALLMTRGHAAPEVAAVYTRARELCRQVEVEDAGELASVLFGLWRFYVTKPALQTTQELGEQLLQLAERFDEPPLHVVAHYALGYTALSLGEPAAARSHLEQGTARYRPDQSSFPVYRTGQDPGVACLAYDSLALWLLGYPEQAVARSQDAIALARELAHPFSQSFALWPATFLHQLRREPAIVQERAEENIALSGDQGFALWLAVAKILHGWALAVQQKSEAGLEGLRQGLAGWHATGANLYVPYFLSLSAEGYQSSGRMEQASQALAEAATLIEHTDERWYEAEIHRREGELILATSPDAWAGAEASFRRALKVARGQHAKSLELRAATSLARLWRQQGRPEQARQLLAPIYEWFTEGFDTPDLRDAEALMAAMESTAPARGGRARGRAKPVRPASERGLHG